MSRRAGRVAAIACTCAFALVAPSARADGAPSARADSAAAPSSDEALNAYTSARESYAAGLYGRALDGFERSLVLLPSPNTRLYIARSLRELGRWSEAAEALRVTIREAEERGGKYVATREAAATELEDVLARLAHAPVAPAPAPRPALLVPIARDSSPPPSHTESPPPSTSRAAIGPTTWVAAGVFVAAAATSGVLYALGSDRYAYLETHCASLRDASCDAARSTGKTEETAAYVALGVAAVAAATAVVSWSLDARVGVRAAPRAGTGRVAWPLRF